MPLSDTFDFGDFRHINSRSMNTMTLSVGNQPVRSIISTPTLKRDFVTNIPFLSGNDFYVAQVADATVTHKYVNPHFCGDANTLHWRVSPAWDCQ